MRKIFESRSAYEDPIKGRYISDNYQKLLDCPTEHLALAKTEKEKSNLKKMYVSVMLNKSPNFILDNYDSIDVDQEIERYKRIHHAVYRGSSSYSPGMLEIINSRSYALRDAKKICSDRKVDTTSMGPVRDQQDTGWCYASAAADVLSWHSKKKVSMVDIAILHNNFSVETLRSRKEWLDRLENLSPFYKDLLTKAGYIKNDESSVAPTISDINRAKLEIHVTDGGTDGAFTEKAMGIAMTQGVCSEIDIPSDKGNDTLGTRRLSAYYSKYFPDAINSSQCVNLNGQTKAMFPNLNLKQIEEIIDRTDPFKLLLKLRNANCKQTIQFPNKKVVSAFVPQVRETLRLINAQLDKRQPSILMYDTSMISDQSGGHASTIIGRRFNETKKICEYQIRNSYGPAAHSKKVKYDNGNYWVDERTLKAHTHGVTAID